MQSGIVRSLSFSYLSKDVEIRQGDNLMSKFVRLISMFAVSVAVAVFVSTTQAGIIGYWDFEGDMNDSSPNGNNADMSIYGPGNVNLNLTFETDTPFAGSTQSLRSYTGGGIGNVVSVPTSPSLESITDSVSISFWMKSDINDNPNWSRIFQHGPESSGYNTWLVNRNSGNNDVNVRVDTDTDPSAGWNQNIAVGGGPNPYDNTWHHMVFSMDSGQWKKYVDGTMVGNGTYSHDNGFYNDRYFNMFGRNNTGGYVGYLDEVAVFDSSISLNQAEYLFAGGDPLNLPEAQAPPLLGIGPEGGNGFVGIHEVKNNGNINGVTAAINSLLNGTGTITQGTASMINHNDPEDNGGGGYFGDASKMPFLSNTTAKENDFVFLANGNIKIETADDYTFGFRGDDGSQLRILGADFTKQWGGGDAYDDTIIFPGDTGDSNTAASTYLEAGIYPFEYIFYENGGGAFTELWAAQGIFSSFDANSFALVGDVANGGLELVAAQVPEPTTWAIFALGLLGLGYHARRRRS